MATRKQANRRQGTAVPSKVGKGDASVPRAGAAQRLASTSMEERPKMIGGLPEWIYEMADGDECLRDVLVEGWVIEQHARRAVLQRGDAVPRTCSEEYKAAKGILDAIRTGRVPRSQLAQKAAQAVRKFDTARQCARVKRIGLRR
jgi:hypothetical protein